MSRLIDADEIYKEIIKIEYLAMDRVVNTDEMIGDRINPMSIRYTAQLGERTMFKYMIMDAPTVDAVHVRHGRWIKYTGMGKVQWMCSECGAEEKNPKIANWCYHCGARMDGEEE